MKRFLLCLTGFILIVLTIVTVNTYRESQKFLHPRLKTSLNTEIILNTQDQEPDPEQLQPMEIDEAISYSLQNDELNITFNHGDDWVKVPVEKDRLFRGDYNGSEGELIKGSFILEENRVGFLYSDGIEFDNQTVVFLYSTDQGESWDQSIVTEPFSGLRFRKVDFLDDHFGYIIISGYRTMSSEGTWVFLTDDGGENWRETEGADTLRLIYDGGFVDQLTGFLSFGTINPEEPDVYLTEDGGDTWTQATYTIPKEYQGIFVSAEAPEKEADHLTVLVNQGPNGDYQGGGVKGKFTSDDNGKTWEFEREVEPDEAE